MEPNLEWDELLAPAYLLSRRQSGAQGVANEVFGRFPTYFLEFEDVPEEFIDAEDRVIILGEFQGKESKEVLSCSLFSQ
jgi:hypothetical protein